MENNGKPYTNFCLFKVSWRDFNKAKKGIKMDFVIVMTGLTAVCLMFGCFVNCILKEDSKLFCKLEKLF